MRASVVIATYEHAWCVAAAVDSALAQTEPGVEVIVVDDGSSDDTQRVLRPFGARIVSIRTPHRGVAAARNLGLAASSGRYVMFLDADDVIEPDKITVQRGVIDSSPYAGFAYCDVLIVDLKRAGSSMTASSRYAYAERRLEGDLSAQLAEMNFIPNMAPLYRRTVIRDVAFIETEREDWLFLRAVAQYAPACYTPRVLATYRKHRNGRNSRL